jgi:pimeloyl-ACP methyl ester carboxylesterase
MRIIAPDLPGYGWSGPAPHKWAKEDVASDVLALLDALGLDRVLLVAHDWGAFVGYLMVLRAPERFDGYLALNMAHPWVPARSVLPQFWRFWYQLPLASFGVLVQQRTGYVERVMLGMGSNMGPEAAGEPDCAR